MKKTFLLLAAMALLGGAACSMQTESATQCEASCAHHAAQAEPPWQLAIATYTFNKYTLFETIEKARQCGVDAIEVFGWHKISAQHGNMQFNPDMTDAAIQELNAKLDENQVKIIGYYAKTLGKDEAADRKLFEFCRKMGIRYIVSEPDKSTLPALDSLAQEYRIQVAIHNHPPRKKDAEYANWHPEGVMSMLAGRSEWMGVCADTGHWVRSELDPVMCIRKCKGRMVSLHLKDVHESGSGGHDVPYGTGVGKTKEILAELKEQGFAGAISIEYEPKRGGDYMKDVIDCVTWFEQAKRELGVKGRHP